MSKNDQLFEDLIQGISANALGTSAEAEKPFPMTDSLPLWYDLFVVKSHYAFIITNVTSEVLPTVSNLRFILYKMMRSYAGLTQERKEKARESYRYLFNFILTMIPQLVPEDSFCTHSNLLYSQDQVEHTLLSLTFKTVLDREESRLLAKLNLGLMSVVHGVYNDIVTDFGVDVYGPYQVHVEGENLTLLIKHFPELNPKELNWSAEYLPNVKELFLYLLYKDMEWEIKGVGCHTNIISGNPIDDLVHYAVYADGKPLGKDQIQQLTNELLKKSQDLYISIIDSGFEEQKKQALFQECYQFKKIFDKADIEWRPDNEMIERVKGIQILPTPGVIQSLEEYRKFLKLDEFKAEIVE